MFEFLYLLHVLLFIVLIFYPATLGYILNRNTDEKIAEHNILLANPSLKCVLFKVLHCWEYSEQSQHTSGGAQPKKVTLGITLVGLDNKIFSGL